MTYTKRYTLTVNHYQRLRGYNPFTREQKAPVELWPFEAIQDWILTYVKIACEQLLDGEPIVHKSRTVLPLKIRSSGDKRELEDLIKECGTYGRVYKVPNDGRRRFKPYERRLAALENIE